MSKRKSVDLLPVIFRTDANQRFLAGTVDQLIQKPELKKIDGYIGDKTAKNFKPEVDSYLSGVISNSLRDRYELEPGIVIKNPVTDKVEFSKTYEDILNSLKLFGSNIDNQDKLFTQQSYAWNPHIDLDKFVNYRNYIWQAEGPQTILITGKEKQVVSTLTVSISNEDSQPNWKFSTNITAVNPTLTLYRGFTYIFEVDTVDNPFFIKTKRTSGSLDAVEGVVNNGANSGTVIFEVKESTPGTLFYVSGKDNTVFGKFLIRDQQENTELNVELDIVGKKSYQIKPGFNLSNGMKISFADTVVPETYRAKSFIVEGVGKSIKLVDYEKLVTIESYAQSVETSFDSGGFDDVPFDEVAEYPVTPDYIVINRSSKDLNPWSRYNRWFHIDVILASAEFNGIEPVFDETLRAKRPIVEFVPDLQLFNFATKKKKYVDFLDDTVTDAFSNIEGSLGFYIDGFSLEEGNRIIFTKEEDSTVRNRVYQVQYLNILGVRRLHLEPSTDSEYEEGKGLLVLRGSKNGRTSWVFKNNEWTHSQQKTELNQSPLFDVFDADGDSYGDSKYKENNFSGCRVFGYNIGTGAPDPVLGFNIKFGNVANVGGYLFENHLATLSCQFLSEDNEQQTLFAKDGFLKINSDTVEFVNSWVKCNKQSTQEIIDQKIAVGGEQFFEFDSLNVKTPKTDVRVFKNGTQLPANLYDIGIDVTFDSYFINFSQPLVANDVITIKVVPTYDKNETGFYETPINLVNNPLNDFPISVSYAEINDHLNSILLNATKSLRTSVNKTNLRDFGLLEQYGRRFVQHEGLVALAGAMVVDKDINLINTLRWSALEYQKYKTLILQKFIELSGYANISDALDKILIDISKDKTTLSTFYYSDMVPYGLNKRTYDYVVKESNRTIYAYGDQVYNPTELNNKSILVYVNGEQLLVDKDYTFNEINTLVEFKKQLSIGDVISIVVYNNVYGACMPYSPTKLGLYPAFKPEIYLDNTYIEPTLVIQGHDGSLTVSYEDDRDQLLLELEKRIYNNLKVKYDNRVFDINDVVPGIFRSNKTDIARINESIEEEFLRWTGIFGVDYRSNQNAVYNNAFSYNFVDAYGALNPEIVFNGSWRKIYKYYFDTDRPHTHPWEMLGFSEMPAWWENEYGPAPYTSGNELLWDDLEQGYIRGGNRQGYDETYKREGLSSIIPVDSYGDLRDPLEVNVIKSFNFSERYSNWKFGDMGPAENAWRRSHLYPFAVQIAMFLNAPAKYATLCFDTSRNIFNISNQLVYSETNQRIRPKDLKVFGDKTAGFVLATGYSPYLIEHLRLRYSDPATKLKSYIHRIQSNLIYKLGGFSSKDKFKVALETVSSNKTVNQVFVPEENYQLTLSVSSPINTIAMSGVIVERNDQGFSIRGYDSVNPYFKINKAIESPNDPIVSVGGVTESFIYWAPNSNVNTGTVVLDGQRYYRAISNHLTKETFDPTLYYPLPYLPKVGGVEATVAQSFEQAVTIVPYGTIYRSIQEVFNFIMGYGTWLENQGFVFDTVLNDLEVVANWLLAGKEFLFWTSQSWNVNSVISLAPFAAKVVFENSTAIVDDVHNSFYDYSLLKSDGTIVDKTKVDIIREGGKFTLDTSKLNNDGVYFVKISLVQKEHCVIFDNRTIFNDLIYEPISGYRQLRFKVKGIITDNWNGDYYVPGFVYDSAKIEDWQPDVDYSIGDVVKFQTNYYQAKSILLPSATFKVEDWEQLGKQPIAQLLPNFEYKISQFEDFYSLDSVNFDNSQQKYAQKLIGYVPRSYLNSIITDESSQYKFYQGYIREKGTSAPLEKFSVAHNNKLGSHISLDEEWAIRLGIFGGDTAYKEIEFTLDQNKFAQDPQIFELQYDSDSETPSDKSYAVSLNDILIKPEDYNGKPWPILDTNIVNGNGYQQYQKIPTAGYARLDDVTFTALYDNNILTLSNITSINEGDTIWVAMDAKGDWNVRRYTISSSKVITFTVDNENNLLQFVTDVAHNLKLRDYVALNRLPDPVNSVYEVIGVPTPNSFIVRTTFNDIVEPTELLNGAMYYFPTSKFATFNDLANIPGIGRWADCEFVWVDDDGTGNWIVLEKERAAKATPLRPFNTQSNQHFGNTVAIGSVSKNIIVSATANDRGRIFVYERQTVGSEDINLVQSYLMEENLSDALTVQTVKDGITVPEMPRNHGKSLDIWESADLETRYIVSGAPNSSNAKWAQQGVSTPIKKVLAFTNQSSDLYEEGALKIAKFDTLEQLYITDVVLASPFAQESANFGHDVKFVGTDKPFLIVSAPGQNQRQGSVFFYYLDNQNEWQVVLDSGIPYDLRSEIPNLDNGSEFGWSIAASSDGSTVTVSAPNFLKDRTQIHSGAVFIFHKDPVDIKYSLFQTIYADDYIDANDLILKGAVVSYNTGSLTLTFDSNDKSITRASGNFITDGFRIGQSVAITGTPNNDGEYIIADLTSVKMTFGSASDINSETLTTGIVTFTGLGTARKDRFGDKLATDSSANTIVISSDHAAQNKLDAGLLYLVSKSANGQYVFEQKVYSPNIEAGEQFGSNVSISPDGNTLLVTAELGDQATPMYFDSYTERLQDSVLQYGSEYVLNARSAPRANRTTFDNNSTRFVNRPKDSGAVYLYQRLGNKFVYGETLLSEDTASADNYGSGIATDGEFCLVGAPKYDLKAISTEIDSNQTLVTYPDAGTVIVFDKKNEGCGCGNSWSWSKARSQGLGLVDVDKIKKVISYNNSNLEILENYEIYDPVKGKFPTAVSNEIKYITPFDPAVYTVAVQTNSRVRVDNKTTWTEEHVGELWLDTSSMRYMWYEQGSAEFRSNNWGRLFPGSTVDVYEWVKSDYRPSEWAQLADTPEGLAQGLSGQPKNPDNTVVSINQYFDPIINDFVNVYYFWVRNKITLPSLNFRSISAFECSRIIEDPKTQGIKYASFLSPTSLSLSNTKKDADSNKVNIDIYYQDGEENINRHSHWQLVNENSRYTNIDPMIVDKMIDSLTGQDKAGNLVPDPSLSPKLKYGTLFRPRQSWFKNRETALETVIKYVNKILEKEDVVGKVNLDNIDSFEEPPLESKGFYDEVVETTEDLAQIGTLNKNQAVLEPVIVNGRLVNVNIIDAGLGYKIAPVVTVLGLGTGAIVETAINIAGRITSVKIVSQGVGYSDSTKLVVRPHAVLVLSDLTIGRWGIYHLESNVYQRKISQTYDTRKYWNYIDWVASSYDPTVPAKFTVSFITDLEGVNYDMGDTVEIRNTGDNRKIVLEKVADGTGNYIEDYDLVFRQNGSIQFSAKLYNKKLAGIGFDSAVNFDQNSFDETLSKELRIILEAIRDDIFIGDLAPYWNKLIFTAIRYVLSEQLFVDWIYKTSFITPIIDAGEMDQKEVYRFNDFSYVEEFIKEVKPFKSKFRDITVKHNANETVGVSLTDFDLPAYVDQNTGIVRLPTGGLLETVYPFKSWNDNNSFEVDTITVTSTGANYIIPPVITVVPALGDPGRGATAEAKISEGRLSEIIVINKGTGYLTTPKIVITGGGNYTDNFVPGTAAARLSNNKVRSNGITFKFDRTSEKGLFTGEIYNRLFTTDGTTLSYLLTYPVDDQDTNYPALQDKASIRLFLNESEISTDNYRVIFREDLSTLIALNVALPSNQQLRIQYIKNTLYTKDVFTQSQNLLLDRFKLTYPPELDSKKIIIKLINTSNGTGSEIASSDYRIQVEQQKVGFTKYVGYIKFRNIPPVGSVIAVQYAKNINILNAVDRIISKYEPTVNMPGKDITQLMKGIEFGGVEIQGLNFVVSSGWDGLPWFTQGWDTFVNEFKDLLVISDGTTATYELGYVPVVGTQINVYFDNIRVDDENYGTVNQKNQNALFKTIIANGTTSTITLPVIPAANVKIEVRQSMSDGVNLPTDEIVLDTNLSGGDFTFLNDAGEIKFRTASGIRPDDITVDGGQFLSVEHNPATEELVKGEIFDSVAISVFNGPGSGSNQIDTYQFQFDGTNTVFTIPGAIDTEQSIEVLINNFVANLGDDFTIASNSNKTTSIDILTTKYGLDAVDLDNRAVITIRKTSIGGNQILYRQNYIVSAIDAAADSFEIDTPINFEDIGDFYISTSKAAFVSKVAGRSKRAKIVVTNNSPKIQSGTLVTVILFSSLVKTYSEIYNQEIVIDSNTVYTLERPPGNIEPLHVMAAVTRVTPATLNWQGAWEDNVNYLVNDSVVYKNVSYVCKVGHLSIGSNTTQPFPIWEEAIQYQPGDVVIVGTEIFYCLLSHTSNTTTLTPFNTTYWRPHVSNRPDEDTNFTYWEVLPKQRLMPPETEYYEVSSTNQAFYLGNNIPYLPRSLTTFDIEVYRNGKMLVVGQDFEFDFVDNSVTLSTGVAQVGDVVAISVIKNADYLIRNGQIIFTNTSNIFPQQRIIVTTYTNHDENLMRREIFKGYQIRNEYKLSRPVFSIENVWVDFNGRPLMPNVDFDITDNIYVRISEKFDIENTDRIVVTSISDLNSGSAIAYRIFKDMTNGTQFKRLSTNSSTSLARGLQATDREIEVLDVSVFGTVSITSKTPGVVFVAGERIEFRSIVGNRLGNLTRGTLGTGVAEIYPSGTKIYNMAQSETVPYREGNKIETFATPLGYRYNPDTQKYEKLVGNSFVETTDLGVYELTNFEFKDGIAYEDQVVVYLAGKPLLKPAKDNNPIIRHDFNVTLFSDEVNSENETGDIEVLPDFVIVKEADIYLLKVNPEILAKTSNFEIIPSVQIRVVQKIGKIWYTLDGDNTIQQEDTVQAKFLQEFAADIPDKYYYTTSAGIDYLRDESGNLLTDENGDPLERD